MNIRWVTLWDSLGGCNHVISVIDNWIFDANLCNALELNKSNLDLCCGGDEDVEASFVTIRKGYQFVLKQITPGKSKMAKQCINKCKKEEESIVQINEDFGLL